ncbi:hypothetical protein ACFYOF_44710 [Streptomyces sp. NPDC007148]|uniref:hypothetical protein n=1 Tax=Streptomyces sp. NPDC007148 TaxID=3364775 RepID=UPI0036791C76
MENSTAGVIEPAARTLHDPGTAADIAAQVAGLYGPDAERMAPCLALGTFERVGSNWLSDSLRPVMPQHNEPFRQQLGREHPLSPRNRVPVDLGGAALSALGRHHLACALSDLYGSPRHLVKETNLFFATDTVLQLLPDSRIVVLTRAPIGIASSFERGGLWERWAYGQRYAQVAASARSPRWREFAPLVPLDDPAAPVALGRLIALNALLLAGAVAGAGRDVTVVSYERHVSDRPAVLAGLARSLGVTLPSDAQTVPGQRDAVDATFATNQSKDELIAEVDPTTADLVKSNVAATMARASRFLEPHVTATAAEWLAGDDLYEVRKPVAPRRKPARSLSPARPLPAPMYRSMTPGVSWRDVLVTNAEMAELLTLLHAAGLPNTQQGTNLLVCPMPHERGGRLHFDRPAQRWRVSPSYETHPLSGSPGSARPPRRHGSARACPPGMRRSKPPRAPPPTTATTSWATRVRSWSPAAQRAGCTTWSATCRSGAATAPRSPRRSPLNVTCSGRRGTPRAPGKPSKQCAPATCWAPRAASAYAPYATPGPREPPHWEPGSWRICSMAGSKFSTARPAPAASWTASSASR